MEDQLKPAERIYTDGNKNATLSPLEEFLGDVCFDDLHSLQFLEPLRGQVFRIMLPEMLNILRVCEFVHRRIVAVVLLEVMDLIFVFDIAVMARPESEIGQPSALGYEAHPIVCGDDTCICGIKDTEYLADDLLFALFAYTRVGRIVKTICFANFLRGPNSRAVIIVEYKEGRCIEVINVVLLLRFALVSIVSAFLLLVQFYQRYHTLHVSRRPV